MKGDDFYYGILLGVIIGVLICAFILAYGMVTVR